jgi:hypothetical protein
MRMVTLNERYQVYVDFIDGGEGVLVNSYSRPEVAAKAVRALNSELPGSFVTRAWVIDTETGAEIISEYLTRYDSDLYRTDY